MNRQLFVLLLVLPIFAATPIDQSVGPAVDGKCPPGTHQENGLCFKGEEKICARPVGPATAAGCPSRTYKKGDMCCQVPNCCPRYLGPAVNGLCPDGFFAFNRCCCSE